MPRSMNRRYLSVSVGRSGEDGVRLDGVFIEGSVKLSTSRNENEAKVQIYNLSDSSRALFGQQDAVVEVRAGVDGNVSTIFLGDVGLVRNVFKAPDIITDVKADDGRRGLNARVSLSFDDGVSLRSAVGRVADLAGVPVSRFSDALNNVELVSGWSYAGSLRGALTELGELSDAEWSIQRGQLFFLQADEPVQQLAKVYRPGTGLIESPERTEDGIEMRVLLDASIVPGVVFKVESRFIEGFYRVVQLEHVFDTRSGPWETNIEATPA